METIELSKYRSGQSRIYVGRDRGEKVRDEASVDRLDVTDTQVDVVIPKDTFSVNISFFLGMFASSIKKLGEENFRQKYLFRGKDITRVINDGIREALSSDNPLGS